MQEFFRKVSAKTSELVGTPWAFILAIFVVLAWAVTGPMFGYSDTWQLVINTGTTIVTFLMVFLIQNAQNRDARALHLKMDEIIRSMEGARNSMVNLENLSDEELERLHGEFQRLRGNLDAENEQAVIPVEELQEVVEDLEESVQEELEERRDDREKRSARAVRAA
jgi:low affinity Fe/Cu permease